jgi:ABC-2 type transport system permease protein
MKAVLARYVFVAKMQARTVLVYRTGYIIGLARLLLQIYLMQIVWTSLYADRPVVDDVSISVMLAYVALANVQNWLYSPWIFSLIPERVRDGRIEIDLSRPLSFLGQAVASQVGRTAAMFPFALVALPFAIVAAGAHGPASPASAAAYGVSLVLAYGVATLVSVLVGLTAFWRREVDGLFLVYRIASQFLAGAVVPLWFMPGALRIVAEILPFQAITFTPTAIYLGRINGTAAAEAMFVQAGWVVVLWLAAHVVWRRAVRRVVVHGG